MSLILDALKRAERERKLEKAPDLSAIYQEGRLSRRKTRPWFWAGGAFLVTFVAMAIIFWPKAPLKGDLKDKTPKPALADSANPAVVATLAKSAVANATKAGAASTERKQSLAGKTGKNASPDADCSPCC